MGHHSNPFLILMLPESFQLGRKWFDFKNKQAKREQEGETKTHLWYVVLLHVNHIPIHYLIW